MSNCHCSFSGRVVALFHLFLSFSPSLPPPSCHPLPSSLLSLVTHPPPLLPHLLFPHLPFPHPLPQTPSRTPQMGFIHDMLHEHPHPWMLVYMSRAKGWALGPTWLSSLYDTTSIHANSIACFSMKSYRNIFKTWTLDRDWIWDRGRAMALSMEQKAKIQKFLDDSKKEGMVGIVKRLVEYLLGEGLVYKQRLSPMDVGVHPLNRDGVGLHGACMTI